MNRFFFLRDRSKKWILIREGIEKGKDFILNLMKKIGKKIKFIGGKRFYQELSFIEASIKKEDLTILYPSCYSHKTMSIRFRLFIEKEMGRHTILIIIFLVTLPFSAILGLLPGPNIIFWTEIFMLYIYFKAIKGLKTLAKNAKLLPDETLGRWERSDKNEEDLKELTEKIFIENIELLKG